MITKENVISEYGKLDQDALSDNLKNAFAFVNKYIHLYDKSERIKEVVDKFVERLKEYVESIKPGKKAKKPYVKPKVTKRPMNEAEKKEFAHLMKSHNTEKEEKKRPEKAKKPLYKEGQAIYWYDNDGSSRMERIKSIQPVVNKDGKASNDYTVSSSGHTWNYDEYYIKEMVQKGYMSIDKPLPRPVPKILPEVVFIKRFVNLHDKVVSGESVLRLIDSLQKAIIEKVIRKSSKYSFEIEYIQNQLINLYNKMGNEAKVTIDGKMLNDLKKIVESQKVEPAVVFIKRFLRIQGKPDVKEKAAGLFKALEKNYADLRNDGHYGSHITDIHTSLKVYLKGDSKTLDIDQAVLNGLQGIAGCPCTKKKIKLPKSGKVISTIDFEQLHFDPMELNGKFGKIIGNPSAPFSLMIYGLPGGGKSTLALQFANLLSNMGRKVLFVAKEEGYGYTLQEKIKRLQVGHKNLFICDTIPADLKEYDFMFLDSVSSLKLEPDDITAIREKYPEISPVLILHSIKTGNFKGSEDFEHDVDVSIRVDNMVAETKKSRFGGVGMVKVL
jgi:hypothetical protein